MNCNLLTSGNNLCTLSAWCLNLEVDWFSKSQGCIIKYYRLVAWLPMKITIVSYGNDIWTVFQRHWIQTTANYYYKGVDSESKINIIIKDVDTELVLVKTTILKCRQWVRALNPEAILLEITRQILLQICHTKSTE